MKIKIRNYSNFVHYIFFSENNLLINYQIINNFFIIFNDLIFNFKSFQKFSSFFQTIIDFIKDKLFDKQNN